MPSLGFLKKKRTRDANSDPSASNPTSPVTPTSGRTSSISRPFSALLPRSSTTSTSTTTAAQSQPQPANAPSQAQSQPQQAQPNSAASIQAPQPVALPDAERQQQQQQQQQMNPVNVHPPTYPPVLRCPMTLKTYLASATSSTLLSMTLRATQTRTTPTR